MRLTKLAFCLMLSLTSGCARLPESDSSFCALAKPIYVDPDDTLTTRTKIALLEHYELGRNLCGWTAAK